MLYFLLAVIAILIFLVYKKLSEFTNFQNELREDLFGTSSKRDELSIRNFLNYINQRLVRIEGDTTVLAEHVTADNPAGLKSDKYKRINNLAKIYAEHLVDSKDISEKDALIRAKFEIYEFGADKIISEIETGLMTRGVQFKEQDKAEKEYYASGILDKDIEKYWDVSVKGVKQITPYYLMEPMYDVIVKQNYEPGAEIQYMDNFRTTETYYSFVKDRAIIKALEDMGVIKRANDEGWDGSPKWTIPVTDIAKLKHLIYKGETSHDDDYFEENFRDGKLNRLFY